MHLPAANSGHVYSLHLSFGLTRTIRFGLRRLPGLQQTRRLADKAT